MAGRNTAPGLTRTEAAAFPRVSAGGPAAPGVPRGQSWFAGGARHPASIRPHLAEEYAINLPLHPNRHDVFIKNVTEPIICVYVTAVHVVSLGTNNTPLRTGEGGRWFGRGAFLRGFEGGGDSRRRGTEKQRNGGTASPDGKRESHLLATFGGRGRRADAGVPRAVSRPAAAGTQWGSAGLPRSSAPGFGFRSTPRGLARNEVDTVLTSVCSLLCSRIRGNSRTILRRKKKQFLIELETIS